MFQYSQMTLKQKMAFVAKAKIMEQVRNCKYDYFLTNNIYIFQMQKGDKKKCNKVNIIYFYILIIN